MAFLIPTEETESIESVSITEQPRTWIWWALGFTLLFLIKQPIKRLRRK